MIEVSKIRNSYTLCERDFQSLHSKGFGEKVGKLFTIDVYEVLYFLEKGKIRVFDSKKNELFFEDIIKFKNVDLNNHLVFSDLVKKGYDVKSGLKYGFNFRIYPKGEKKGDSHSSWLVVVLSSNSKLKVDDFSGKNRVAHSTRKKVLMAIVDSENSITYFETSWKRV